MTPKEAIDIFKALGMRVSLFEEGGSDDGGGDWYEAAFPALDKMDPDLDTHNIYFKHGGLGRVFTYTANPSNPKEWRDVAEAKHSAVDLINLWRDTRTHNLETFSIIGIKPSLW